VWQASCGSTAKKSSQQADVCAGRAHLSIEQSKDKKFVVEDRTVFF
jgi:hypothetical protein